MRILGTVASSSREVPNAPTIGTATNVGTGRPFNNGAATVAFTAPTFDGGLPITSYTVTSSPGGLTASGSSSPITVTGLSSAVAYTFTVTAANARGTGAASAASNSITATTVPAAPTIGTPTCATGQAFTGSANISVAFTAGATGGSAITSFTATSSGGGTASGASSPISFSRTVGSTYTFTVTATNANGTSAASGTSASVLSASVPQAPTIGTATVTSATSATVGYSANATGGSAITGFTATSSPGSLTGTGSSPIAVSGLTSGTAYTFTVRATNAFGTSAASSASNSVTPVAPANFVVLPYFDTAAGYSADAATWTATTVPYDVYHAPVWGGDRYIATRVGNNGGDGYYFSTNGVTWTVVNGVFSISDNYRTGDYGNGTFVFPSYNSNNVVRSSNSGSTWQQSTLPSGYALPNPSFGGNYFFGAYSREAFYSFTGASWTQTSLGIQQFNIGWNANAFGNGVWLTGATNVNWMAYSFDLANWSTNTAMLASGRTTQSLAFGNGIFVNLNGGTAYSTSTEGWRNWTTRTLPVSITVNPAKGITFSNGTFATYSAFGNSNVALSSTNGTTWTQRTLPSTISWNAIGGKTS